MRTLIVAALLALVAVPATAAVLPPVPGPLRLEAVLSSKTPPPLSVFTVAVRVLDARGRGVGFATVDAVVYWRDRPARYLSLPTSRFGATAIAIEVPASVATDRAYTVLVRAFYRDLRATATLYFTPKPATPRP